MIRRILDEHIQRDLKGVLLMTKKIDAMAMLQRMREKAQTGLQAGTWFTTLAR